MKRFKIFLLLIAIVFQVVAVGLSLSVINPNLIYFYISLQLFAVVFNLHSGIVHLFPKEINSPTN